MHNVYCNSKDITVKDESGFPEAAADKIQHETFSVPDKKNLQSFSITHADILAPLLQKQY